MLFNLLEKSSTTETPGQAGPVFLVTPLSPLPWKYEEIQRARGTAAAPFLMQSEASSECPSCNGNDTTEGVGLFIPALSPCCKEVAGAGLANRRGADLRS